MGMTAVIFIISILFGIFKTPENDDPKPENTMSQQELIDALIFSGDTLPPASVNIENSGCWNPPGLYDEYCMAYGMNLRRSKASSLYKKNEVSSAALANMLSASDRAAYWTTVYGLCYRNDQKEVSHIADSLRNIAIKADMDRVGLAGLVVGFVQDLPYWLIFRNTSCEEGNPEGKPCMTGIPHGLLSPMETAYLALGDCDSRALLLYCLFKHLGFEPLIITSNEYAHAMLALNIPSAGEYLLHHGRRFYFWETTATGWQAGMLPPSCSNKKYWEIALSYEY